MMLESVAIPYRDISELQTDVTDQICTVFFLFVGWMHQEWLFSSETLYTRSNHVLNPLCLIIPNLFTRQRRREEDFQRYVSEFRTSISALKSERTALLALTSDNQGEKSHLLATSQKALAQAAQWAADEAEARKRSSEAAFQRIAARSAGYLSRRLETLLPSGGVSAELAAVKGEMSLARVADTAAVSLVAVEEVFNRAIQKGSAGLSEFDTVEEGASMAISDAASQQIAVMTHQAEFSKMAIEAAMDTLRLMATGQ